MIYLFSYLFFLFTANQQCSADLVSPKPPIMEKIPNLPEFMGLSVYQAYSSKDKSNIFLSPASIAGAVSLALEGAQGDTKKYNAKFIQRPLISTMKLLESSKDVKISFANAIWLNSSAPSGHSPLPAFKTIAEKTYGAQLKEADFSKPGPVTKDINSWVSDKTQKLITSVVSDQLVTQSNVLLLNAIYFKGQWQKTFEKSQTKDGVFKTGAMEVKAPFMHQKDTLSYFENSELQILEKFYKGQQLAMTLILPQEKADFPSFEQSLTVEKIKGWTKSMQPTSVDVALPKFKINWGPIDTMKPLNELGLHLKGDFTPLGRAYLEEQSLIHQAVITTDEEGSEAAAVTMMAPRGMAPKSKSFTANRPFIFIIRDTKTDTWLFLGRIMDPSK